MGGNDNCTVCSHHYSRHMHMKVKRVEKEIEVNIIDPDTAKLIAEAQNDLTAKEKALNNLKTNVTSYEETIEEQKKMINVVISNMREICTDFNYAKEIDLSIEIIKETIETKQHDQLDVLNWYLALNHFLDLKKNLGL